MKQVLYFPLFVLIACIIAAGFGIIHDIFTHCISPEYYTKFKFIQFGFIEEFEEDVLVDNRLTYVALTGIIATWWTGLIGGPIIALVNLLINKTQHFFSSGIKALLIGISCSAIAGLVGLLLGYTYFGPAVLKDQIAWNLPNNVVHQVDYIAVGSMHNFSYIGGAIGIVVALLFIKKRSKMLES